MGLFDIFKRNDDYDKIETPKSYKFNEFRELPHIKNEKGIELIFNLNAIHNTETDINFILINTSNVSDKSCLYVIQLTLKKISSNNNLFEDKIILGQGINSNDREGRNFAKHLNKLFDWNTDDKYLRSLRATVDFENSKNLELNSFLNKEVIIAVSDASNQSLYKIVLNWKDKKAKIQLATNQVETFKNIYFVKDEAFAPEPKLSGEVKKIINIKGFDKDGEPQIQLLNSGHLKIQFEFMPPLNGNDNQSENPIFENFDKVLSKLIGNEIIWDDREVFIVANPTKGDDQKIKKYLEEFWKDKNIS